MGATVGAVGAAVGEAVGAPDVGATVGAVGVAVGAAEGGITRGAPVQGRCMRGGRTAGVGTGISVAVANENCGSTNLTQHDIDI